jgi:alpha-tubulin suppressor-like RCC1 family protein
LRPLNYLSWLSSVIVCVACTNTEPIRCERDVDCAGADGTCEPSGYCSYPDTACVTGRRYDTYASGECTAGCSVRLEAGGSFTCAYNVGGRAYCWGTNRHGELGDGNLTASRWPVETRYVYDVIDLAAGKHHACAATDRETVMCWGANDVGQLGDGTTDNRSAPVALPTFPETVISLAAGDSHTCVRLVGGEVWCWGDNRLGQLGDEADQARTEPAVVPGMTDAIGLAMGEGHSCSLDAGGDVWCWGYNGYGQLGDGTFTSHATPRLAGGATLAGASQVVAGGSHTCALTESDDVWCWGANYSGQLGDGTTGGSSVPVRLGLENVIELAAGTSHTCALVADGTVWCWGANRDGQLGDGSLDNRDVPIQVAGLASVVEVTAGMAHTCARTLDGRVHCWGSNADGQLGDGTFDSTPVPVTSAPICR